MPAGHTRRDEIGRIIGTYGLTENQAAFVKAFVENGSKAEAAALQAGYSTGKIGYNLTRHPAVQAAIKTEVAAIISTDLASLAVGTIREILEDKTTHPKIRLDAAKTALDRAGHVARIEIQQGSQGRPLAEMSIEELEAEVNRLKHDAAERSKPVLDAAAVRVDIPAGDGDQEADKAQG